MLAVRVLRPRPRRARLDAVARRQRDPEGGRRVPANRVDAVLARVLRHVRSPVDQPRPDRRRGRAEQGARPLRDGRRHPLPARTRTPARSSSRSGRSPTSRSCARSSAPPAHVSRTNPYVVALREAVAPRDATASRCRVGRDGASDAVSFLSAGMPAVEFGPAGAGHHGPEEWVSISLARPLPPGAGRLRARGSRAARARRNGAAPLRAVEGGRREPPSERPPRRGPAMLLRAALAGVLHRARAHRRRRVATTVLLRGRRRASTRSAEPSATAASRSRPEIDDAEAGKPQTIMVLGSDRR